SLTPQLLDEVREQKESLNPNTRKFVVDDTVVPVDEVYDACAPLIEQTLSAMEPAMRDPRRGEDEVAWTELAGIYVVGGASSFPPVYRRLREKFGALRVRRRTAREQSLHLGRAALPVRTEAARSRSRRRSRPAPWPRARSGGDLPVRRRRHGDRESPGRRRRIRKDAAPVAEVRDAVSP